MTDRVKIDVTEVLRAWASEDGRRLHVKLVTAGGSTVTLTLPISSLNAVLTPVTPRTDPAETRLLDTWTMRHIDNGGEVLLTLCTADGEAVSFVTKAAQIEGMATIATYGRPGRRSAKVLH